MAMMFWRMASKPSILFRTRCTDLASNKMVGECLESVWTVLDPLASRNLANLVCQMQWNGERGRTFMFQAATRPYELDTSLFWKKQGQGRFPTDCGASCASRACMDTKEMPYEVTQDTWLQLKSDTNMNLLLPKYAQDCSTVLMCKWCNCTVHDWFCHFEASFGDKGFAGYHVSSSVTSHEAQLD